MADIQEQIRRLQDEIAEQQTELSGLEADVLDIERELSAFVALYNRVIQPLITRLEVVQDAIAELEQQRHAPPPPAPDPDAWSPPPGYVSVEEQFRRAWQRPEHDDSHIPLETPWSPPPDYVPVEEQFRRAWQRPLKESETSSFASEWQASRPTTQADINLKQLYRKLVRQYHPDLTTDPLERKRRNKLMAEINDAYSRQDAEALRTLDTPGGGFNPRESLASMQLRQLQQIASQLAQRIAELKRKRLELLNGEMMSLKVKTSLAAREGRDLLREMADQLEADFAANLRRLDELRGL